MVRHAYHVLRFGLAVTFVWVGVMILQDPVSWSAFIQSWARGIIPFSIETAITIVGIFDIILGLALAIDIWTSFVALVAAIHLAGILLVSGVDAITVRDVGLVGASAALSLLAREYGRTKPSNESLPPNKEPRQ